ncbi:Alpha/Beta hydrolase protein [Rhypophila decipiens]|uniref:feruloyl esterase n=1 Tax=Rhypophila decipiens TaxID=261697 RepID=A0AAN7B394_9PEZI|nr:Alpha/Beta hydrolase protein [Rhypophila decipiens]
MLTNLLAVGVLALSSLVSTASAAPSAGCGKNPTISSTRYNININGKNREYYMKLPDNYDKNRPYRLIFTWHQLGGSAQKIVNGEDPNKGGALPYYGLVPHSNNSAIFVVPNGLNQGWGNTGGEDVTFFDKLVERIEADLCVDTSLRFSTGFSYGGAMSYALACARPKMIRAVAVISGAQLSGCSGGNDPVAYYGQHGTSDSVLNISMGRQLRDKFVKNNGCQSAGEPQAAQGRSARVDYKGCKEGYPVTWVLHTGDHNPSQKDNGQSQPFAPGNSWQFFSQFASQ